MEIIYIVIILVIINTIREYFVPPSTTTVNHVSVQEIDEIFTPLEPPPPSIPERPVPTIKKWEIASKVDVMDYETYITSDNWLLNPARIETLALDKHKCRMCGDAHNIHVHHIVYLNLGAELLEDLVTLCAFCHSHTHSVAGKGAGYYPPIRKP